MGKNEKKVKEFIENIPDSKLLGFGTNGKTIHTDVNLRLDMQGMTSSKPPTHNLQVQVNKGCRITSLALIAPDSVAMVFNVPEDGSWTPQQIKEKLIASIDVTPSRGRRRR